MRLKVLCNYDRDTETKFGDCILLYDNDNLVIYDCGHEKHAETVVEFLESNTSVSNVMIVVSHDHEDHTDGIEKLFEFLSETSHNVTVYTPLYLKDTRVVLDILDDDKRTLPATKKNILKIFDGLAAIVSSATELGFSVENARIGTTIAGASCEIVGPTEEEFAEVVAEAIKTDGEGNIDGETVMNAASVQLMCSLNNNKRVLLCGDASPKYLRNLEDYRIVQLPHHGKLSSAEAVFEKISKLIGYYTFIISDNTGNSNGGSDDLMASEASSAVEIMNTKDGDVIELGGIHIYARAEEASQRHGICGGL